MYEYGIDYKGIFHVMKKEMCLDSEKIDFKFYDYPLVVMFKETSENKYEKNITVYMRKDSQVNYYKANLAHELWHVKTGLELIQEIGIDEFARLHRENQFDYYKSLAFRTLSEFHSWYKAISEYNENQCSYALHRRLDEYKNKKIDEIELCDTIAAHYAWNEFHGKSNKVDSVLDHEKLFIEHIMQIIKNNKNWPLSLESFQSIGNEMYQAFAKFGIGI